MLILTTWVLSHQRCNYFICKSKSFGHVKNWKFSYRQIMQTTMMNLWCECSLCHVWSLHWARCSFVQLLSLPRVTCDNTCVAQFRQCGTITHLCRTQLPNAICKLGQWKQKCIHLMATCQIMGNFLGWKRALSLGKGELWIYQQAFSISAYYNYTTHNFICLHKEEKSSFFLAL